MIDDRSSAFMGKVSFVFHVLNGVWWYAQRAGEVYPFPKGFQLVFGTIAKSVNCVPRRGTIDTPTALLVIQ